MVSPLAMAAPALKERARPSPIVGEWEATDGNASGPLNAKVIAFGGDVHRICFDAEGHWRDSNNRGGRYTVDPKSMPSTIRLVRIAGEPEGEYSGTFHVEGDSLTLTLPIQPDEVKSTTKFRRIKPE
jgi:hypothetical protein